LQVLHRAQAPSLRGARTVVFLYFASCRCNGVAHPTTDRPKSSEVDWIRQTVSSENVREDDVEGKARKRIRGRSTLFAAPHGAAFLLGHR
jgi:hypothetical protein